MPYVNIRIAGTLSREQKAKIAEEITDTLERIALKPTSYTYIAFDELPDENWAIAGRLWTKSKVYAAAPAPAGSAPPCHSRTYIAFDELPDENWAIAGRLLDEE